RARGPDEGLRLPEGDRNLEDRGRQDRREDLRHADPEPKPELAQDVDRDDHRGHVEARIPEAREDDGIRSGADRERARGHASGHDTAPMSRDDERSRRAQQPPIVGGLPDVPGIGAAMRLKPELGLHLRGLADELLVNDFPGATISRYEREVLATAVSAGNDCFFCMDSHAAHATALLEPDARADSHALTDVVKQGRSEGFDPKM